MRVLFVSSEIYPLAKTGGLADVAGALPPALAALGLEPRLLMPGYPEALDKTEAKGAATPLGNPLGAGDARLIEGRMPDSGLPVWLIDCPSMFDRKGGLYQDEHGHDWADNALRFGLLSWTAARLSQETAPMNWLPDILHVNDWQAGMAPAFLHAWGGPRPGTVATIHNMAYQGLFAPDMLPRLGLPWSMYGIDGLEYYNHVSFLKAGLYYSDRLTTVSPTYAREIQTSAFGCGLEGLLAHRSRDLSGILNGADYAIWNPAADRHLTHRHDLADLEAKALNKAALQREMGLPVKADAPLLIIISRLTGQKGMDMVLAAMPGLLNSGMQLAVLGAGDRALEDHFRAVAQHHPDQVAVTIGYNEGLAHRLQAGGDMLLMPSRFEPCGLTQIYAFRYGTIPVVHRTGGLADTVVDATYDSLLTGTATGFVFDQSSASAMQWCVERAIGLYRQPDQWRKLRATAIAQDFNWSRSAEKYRDLYRSVRPDATVGKPRHAS